jgi:tRNA dimethylallyltransferase
MSSSADSAAGEIGAIVGPTAAGKSAVAMLLAERRDIAIVSADSRQIYQGFDIGTAKPSEAERRTVRHFGIDLVEPTERYSAFAWANSAEEWIAEARSAGVAPVVVGGTGLYVRALAEPGYDEPPLDPERRAAIQRLLGGLPIDELRRWVGRLDPARAHLGRTQLLRSVEVALLTGRPLTVLHRELERPPRVDARYLLVDPGAVLRDRIASRAQEMLASGWKEEVERLAATVPRDAPAWKASGYRALLRHVSGEIGEGETLEEIVISTRQYAKRQRTWFRHQLPAERVTRLDPTRSDAADVALAWLDSIGSRR